MSKSVTFETNLTKCHLRALSYQKPFLLIGMGSTLHILKTDMNGVNQVIFRQIVSKTFIINKIETIKYFESDSDIEIIVCIYGNRFLSIYKFSYNYNINKISSDVLLESHNFYDWILSVKMVADIVFVVKAHNEVVIFDWKTKQTIEAIQGSDKCILYSAEVLSVTESPNSFVLSSGTVFKEIIIWSAYQTPDKRQLVSKVLQRLSGHDGVIFALNYNKSLNILVSASDDRSVRIWTSSLNSNQFRDSIEFWERNKFTESHVFYGHLSRIWTVRTIAKPFPLVLSVGEDSSLYLWNINDKKLIQRVDGHKNSSIWTLSLDIENMITYFGGSDSTLTSCDILKSIKSFNCVVRHELCPKQIKFLSFESHESPKIFCSTISGDLLLMSAQNNENIFRNSGYNKIFKTYSAIDVNEQRNRILLGSKCGTIASIEVNDNENQFDINLKKVEISKIFSICFVDSFKFIVCGIEGTIKLFPLKTFDELGQYTLPISKHRWSVAGLLYNRLLVVGDRCGSIFIYCDESKDTIKEFNHLHGSNGVTAIKLKPNSNLLYSSGRNGKIFEFYLEDNDCSLLRTFRIFADMEWIANFLFDEQTNEMSLIYGFQSRNFVVWDERQQRFVETIECGGGHRSWDFTLHCNSYYFCYTKQENVISFDKEVSKIRIDSNKWLTQSSHSKKINCCSLLFFDSLIYFVTAGEDNVIHVNSLDVITDKWQIESYLFGHISNISAISCSSETKNSCFMVSVGGRSQLMFWKIQLNDKQLICKQLFNKFLWPSDVIQNRCHKNNNFISSSDPQIRYLDVNMSQMVGQKYLISTACSDSAFRLFVFDSKQMTFEMIAINSFNTSCVLRVFNFFDSYVMTASNDGTLKMWSIDTQMLENCDELESKELVMKQVLDVRPHECGINALDVFHFSDNLWLIASGGDDNTLSLSLIKCEKNGLTLISSIDEKYIHSCQITGIKIISKNTIVSASIDQRVVVWNYNFDSKTLRFELQSIASYVSSIADISSFCITFVPPKDRYKAIICGEGFQAIDVHFQ